ncbi:MAG: Dynamin family protein [Desulfobacterales bacterium CG23_combo_of_CG06-09_8_20_14_all_51_8]|nr:MAG: Dynamin family protein [Desulfobacterales bacterium CG23_combo_of_CG06-09_8_20_14_all_51_8]
MLIEPSVAPAHTANGRALLSELLKKTADAAVRLESKSSHYQRQLTYLNSRLSEGRFHLAVLGQFKRGKSTLLNALAGESILPVGVVPLTAVPTFMEFGDTPKVRISFQDHRGPEEFSGNSHTERSSFLARFVTEEGNPRNQNHVAEVTVFLPDPTLAAGVVLIDTPGIGSTYRHNTVATLNFLDQCDAALFLISADPPITEVELEFLRQIRQKVPRLFFVLNKIDYLDASELEQALSFYKRTLTEHGAWSEDSPVFCVSARRGLEARTACDSRKWEESGLLGLKEFLLDFLARGKFKAMTEAIAIRAVDCVYGVLMEAAISLNALQLPQQELDQKIALFEESLHRAAHERDLIQDVLEGDKKRVLVLLEDQAKSLRNEAAAVLKEIMTAESALNNRGKSSRSGIQAAWADRIPEFFEQRQADLNGVVKSRLMECLAPHDQRLEQLVETLRRTAADLFQVPYRPLQEEETLEIKRRPYWVLNSWKTDALPVLKSMDQRLEELVQRNVENIRWAMLQNLNLAFARFASRVKERLDETVDATQGAMETARARRSAQGGDVAAEVQRLRAAIGEMEALKAELAAMKPAQSVGVA